jgi:sulfate transport system ATP-binding protein
VSILLERLTKRYDGHPVVNQVSAEVRDGELFVLLGPSGSGKSTVLRMVAGLAEVDEGRVLLHGRDVTRVAPQKRGVGLVFQHYALFRHMTVAANVEFALAVRRDPRRERRRRRDELLEMVGLAGLGERMPEQLSGGQQQRVALARALAHRPEVLLLDEPFGALDAKIRVELRRTFHEVQRQLNVATVFVTHDQDEAFELADRVGVMNWGRLLEVGPPRELYLRPQTEFVATFLGSANLMVGVAGPEGVRLGPVVFPLGTGLPAQSETRRVQVLFRPEDVAVKDSRDAIAWPVLGEAVVEASAFSGSFERLRLRLPALAGVRPIAPVAPFGADALVVEATRSQHQARRWPLQRGDTAWVGVRRLHALTHPGLSLLLLADATREGEAALRLGAAFARRAHARVTVLVRGGAAEQSEERVRLVREIVGRGVASLETRFTPGSVTRAVLEENARRHVDLVVAGLGPEDGKGRVERLLAAGARAVLLVRGPSELPANVLVCATRGEPGKESIRFAGRLVRHLASEVTLLTVVARDEGAREERVHAERFVAAGARTLQLAGVPTKTAIREGDSLSCIADEAAAGAHDLLVLGAPLPTEQEVRIDGVVAGLLGRSQELPILLVRSEGTGAA